MVTTVEGLEMVAVQVRRGAVKQNTSDFEDLVVTMSGRPLRGRGSQLYAGANGTRVAVGVRSFRHLASNGNLEFVMVQRNSWSLGRAGRVGPDQIMKLSLWLGAQELSDQEGRFLNVEDPKKIPVGWKP